MLHMYYLSGNVEVAYAVFFSTGKDPGNRLNYNTVLRYSVRWDTRQLKFPNMRKHLNTNCHRVAEPARDYSSE
jgi:hypothetical protein